MGRFLSWREPYHETSPPKYRHAIEPEDHVKKIISGLALSLGAIALTAAVAPAANAGCGPALLKQDSSWLERPDYGASALQPASLTSASPSMVGMWAVKFVSGGKLFDFGYSVWHSDGTEILNSGGRAPATQNFCLGVWKQTGAATYKLYHPTFSYDSTGKMNARVTIHEDVTLGGAGKNFRGTFEIDVYDPTKGTTLLQTITGDITGSRIAVD